MGCEDCNPPSFLSPDVCSAEAAVLSAYIRDEHFRLRKLHLKDWCCTPISTSLGKHRKYHSYISRNWKAFRLWHLNEAAWSYGYTISRQACGTLEAAVSGFASQS